MLQLHAALASPRPHTGWYKRRHHARSTALAACPAQDVKAEIKVLTEWHYDAITCSTGMPQASHRLVKRKASCPQYSSGSLSCTKVKAETEVVTLMAL